MRTLFRVFGSLAAILILFMAVGLLLPGTWRAGASIYLEVPPKKVFPYLDDLARWDAWTPWGDVESTFDGETSGVGARRSWDHPNFGSGSITITETVPDRLVRYRVVVGDSTLSVEGAFMLEAAEDGTTVTWSEVGDFSWNPILGYTALTMPRSQGAQMEQGLTELKRLLGRP